MSTPTLRSYQANAIDGLTNSLAKGLRRPVLQMATGGGKTLTIAEVIRRAEAKGNRTLFICDSLELVDQAVRAFDSYGLGVGVMQGDHARTDESFLTQVCTAQTLERRIKRYRSLFERYPVALIVIDECHISYKVRETLASLYPHAPIIGLTATPFSKGMGVFYNDIVSAIPMQTMIDQGYLCPFVAYAPFVPDMKGIKRAGSDYAKDAAAEIYNSEIVGNIVDTWLRHGKGRPTLAFACNVAHSKFIAEQFVAAGVKAAHIDGYGGSDEAKQARQDTIDAYKNGEIEILSSVGICTKGFDAPLTGCLIIARPTKSLSLHWQIVGRALRTHPSKTEAIILDHAGNFIRHGFPTDPIEFSLDNGKAPESASDSRKKEEALPTPCPACHTLKTAHTCPQCGFAPERQNTVVNVDGELVKLDQLEKKKNDGFTQKAKDDWMRMFKSYEISSGKKNGYSIHLYKSKFGETPITKWPRETLDPSPECMAYIKSQQIRFAKGKGNKNAA